MENGEFKGREEGVEVRQPQNADDATQAPDPGGYTVDGEAVAAGAAPPKKKRLVVIAVVIIAVIAGGLAAAYAMDVFTKPADKVLRGAAGIFRGDQLTTALKGVGDITADGIFTADIEMSGGSGDQQAGGNLTYAQDSSSNTLSLTGKAQYYGMSTDISGYLDDSMLMAGSQGILGDTVITYPYTAAKTGYITTLAGQDNLDLADAGLRTLHAAASLDLSSGRASAVKALTADVRTLDFTKAGTAECTVGGATKACRGYTAVITSDFADKLAEDISEAYGDEYKDYTDAVKELSRLAGDGSGSAQSPGELMGIIDGMKDVEATFYLDGRNLAAVKLVSQDDEVTISFEGTDVPWHTIVIAAPDEDAVTVKTTVDGTVEKIELFEGSSENAEGTFTFDTSDGGFTLSTGDSTLTGTLTVSGDTCTITAEADGYKFNVKLTDKADVVKPQGTAVDIGNAGSDEIQQLAGTVLSNIYAMSGD